MLFGWQLSTQSHQTKIKPATPQIEGAMARMRDWARQPAESSWRDGEIPADNRFRDS